MGNGRNDRKFESLAQKAARYGSNTLIVLTAAAGIVGWEHISTRTYCLLFGFSLVVRLLTYIEYRCSKHARVLIDGKWVRETKSVYPPFWARPLMSVAMLVRSIVICAIIMLFLGGFENLRFAWNELRY